MADFAERAISNERVLKKRRAEAAVDRKRRLDALELRDDVSVEMKRKIMNLIDRHPELIERLDHYGTFHAD
jgi:hypothetical protein